MVKYKNLFIILSILLFSACQAANRLPTNQNRMPTNPNTQNTPQNTNQNRMPTNPNRLPTNQNRMPTNPNRLPTNQNRMPTNPNTQNTPQNTNPNINNADGFCNWGFMGPRYIQCNGKTYVHGSVFCSSKIYHDLFCEQSYANSGSACEADQSIDTITCALQFLE